MTFNERLLMALQEHIDYANEVKGQTLLKRSKLRGNQDLDFILRSEKEA